jgi:outer membrane receptor protein involved in Fe transport
LTPGFEQVLYTVANPKLKPSTTDNFDIDLAYYFNDAPGLIRAGFFYKKVSNNFTNVLSRPGNTDLSAEFAAYVAPLVPTYPALGSLPASTIYLLSTPQNGEGGKIWGLEFELNRKLNFLPGFLSDFGVIANATYTNAKFPTLVAAYDPTLATPSNPSLAFINLSLDRPLRDQAEWVYNVALDYERDGFQGRLIYTHQDATANSFDEFNLNSITPGYSTLDLRLSYSFKKFGGLLTLFLEGDDLLRDGKTPIVNGAISSQFGDGSAVFNYPHSFQFIGGRTVTFGIRGKF